MKSGSPRRRRARPGALVTAQMIQAERVQQKKQKLVLQAFELNRYLFIKSVRAGA